MTEKKRSEDKVLAYLTEMGVSRNLSSSKDQNNLLDPISQFVADFAPDAEDSLEDDFRVNGVTLKTQKLITEAYREASDREEARLEKAKLLYKEKVLKIKRKKNYTLIVAFSLTFILGFITRGYFQSNSISSLNEALLRPSRSDSVRMNQSQRERMLMEKPLLR